MKFLMNMLSGETKTMENENVSYERIIKVSQMINDLFIVNNVEPKEAFSAIMFTILSMRQLLNISKKDFAYLLDLCENDVNMFMKLYNLNKDKSS